MEVKLNAGGRYIKCDIGTIDDGKRILIKFPYNKALLSEIKGMDNAKYHGFDGASEPRGKWWSVANTPRTWFALDFLQKDRPNPYEHYQQSKILCSRWANDPKAPLDSYFEGLPRYHTDFPLRRHQEIMFNHFMYSKRVEIAAEMRTGKTLVAIAAMKYLDLPEEDVWYVSPKGAMVGVKVEFMVWNFNYKPVFMTYNELVKRMNNWQEGKKAPRFVIFDESHMLKTHDSQRTRAALALTNGMREDYDDDCYVICMTGSPAPKSPKDWWGQCEVACPGYIKEGSPKLFEQRLALVKQVDHGYGTFPQTITFFDNEKKCKECGVLEEDHFEEDHPFIPSINEVEKLYSRLQGLTVVVFKKDCMDLPEKIFLERIITPSPETTRLMKMILDTSTSALEALQRCRELSDGFQYVEEKIGEETCPECNGEKQCEQHIPLDPDKDVDEVQEYEVILSPCMKCNGKGIIDKKKRTATEIPCQKDEELRRDLEEHYEIGRLVVYSGFHGSIDRITRIALEEGWNVIQADGRGWTYHGNITFDSKEEALIAFREGKIPHILFNGNPEAAGMGISLSASPTTIFWSNTFKSADRLQSIERIHDSNMDIVRGSTIIDYIHLPTDRKVLENLKVKKDLQSMSLGELRNVS